eukprot:c20589_g1_i2 orf=576-3107(-)
MAPPAQAQLGFEPAEGPCNSKVCDGGNDDWVSLILSDVGLDADADNSLSLASLANFPLPDLDDVDFSNLDGPAGSHCFAPSFEDGCSSQADVRFNPSGMLQDMEICPSLYDSTDQEPSEGHACACPRLSHSETSVCPSFSHFPAATKEDAVLQSSESGLTNVSSDYPDADTNIPIMDSGSDEDSFYFLVSDMCSEETSSTEIEPRNLVNATYTTTRVGYVEHLRGNGSGNMQTTMDALQSSSSQQKSFSGFNNSEKSASICISNRKRKHLDWTSRSSTPENMAADCSDKLEYPMEEGEVKDEEDQRRQARLMRNRESAQLSRQRKKIYVDELEEKIKTMASTIAELNNTINLISAENINLRRQLGMFGPPPGQTGGMSNVAPWMGAYPPGSMGGSRFMVPGSHVPLVPIPRWKSQQATTVKKTKKPKSEPQEKGASQKASKRTKKVAGVAAAGLLFFVFILLPFNFQFLGLRPILHREERVWPTNPWHMETSNVVVRAGGRVLTGLNEGNNLGENEEGTRMGLASSGVLKGKEEYWESRRAPQESTTCDTADRDHKPGLDMNASVPLAATLFVPRNDRLVRIEGNLIIHSVLAGNKAAESSNQSNKQSVRTPVLYDRGLALRANLKALAVKAAPEEKGALVELQRALAGRSRFGLDGGDIKSVKEDGSLQQWFMEDLTGPVFSSGMCTEVFQFETSTAASSSSPGSGSHVRGANDMAQNKTAWLQENGPRKAGRSGKSTSYAVPLPPVGHKVIFNATSKEGTFTGSKGSYGADKEFASQKHASSSVVVSVLAGPEFGEQSKLSGGNGLSRIFVTVLIDSVKYATYSCMLPSTGTKSHYEVVVA